MPLLQGIKKLFGLLLDDLDCVSDLREATELQVEACMKEEDEVTAASSCDTSEEENPEDDCFGTTTRHLQPELMHFILFFVLTVVIKERIL
jgi:hypothetical protein